MSGAATLFLLRHGRTALNAAGALRGRRDVPLDEVGRQEAARLGDALAGSGLALIVTSPLQRAAHTAAAVAERCGAPVNVDDDLADRDYGPWNGATVAEVAARFGSVDAAPGIEPWAAFSARVLGATGAAVRHAGPVALVAHEAVNRAILTGLVPDLGAPELLAQPTGCWNQLRREGAGPWQPVVVGAVPGR